MDMWLYYEALHRLHGFMNPISPAAVAEAVERLDLAPGRRVLDIACGNGELLVTLAERYGISGVGVELSPYTYPRAEAKRKERVPDADLVLLEMKGEDYEPDEPFDVACCVGASWIWDGISGTLDALAGFVTPGGLILSGEPYWKSPPPEPYLKAEELTADQFPDLHGCFAIAEGKGLRTIWMQAAEEDDWDRYEMLQLASLDEFERENPGHPELAEIRSKARASKEAYLRWGRDCLGFALWVYRVSESPSFTPLAKLGP